MSVKAKDSFLGKRSERTIAANTQVVRDDEHQISVRLYNTPIVTYRSVCRTGGWDTATTVNRLNQFGPGLRFYRQDFAVMPIDEFYRGEHAAAY